METGKKPPLITREEALSYHREGRRGKIEVIPTKSCRTQRDLALAYTPGVAEPCLEIEKDPGNSFLYTARNNLVAVITNGTAVLGLGNIGPRASKPVMEGKAILFKQFADIDVFDIEVSAEDPDEFVDVVLKLETTFGGINLEDIRALAALAREPVPEEVKAAYGLKYLEFGPEYIIPKPLDNRILLYVAPAVAEAAIESGVAHRPFETIEAYRNQLKKLSERCSFL